MNTEVIEKVKEIMGLALELNPTPTKQKTTGCKPTVFVNFSGHTSGLDVGVCERGWLPNETKETTNVYVDSPDAAAQLDDVIDYLNGLIDDAKASAAARDEAAT